MNFRRAYDFFFRRLVCRVSIALAIYVVMFFVIVICTRCVTPSPLLVRDPATGVFRDTVTGKCFVYQAVGAQAWTVDVPCGGSVR